MTPYNAQARALRYILIILKWKVPDKVPGMLVAR